MIRRKKQSMTGLLPQGIIQQADEQASCPFLAEQTSPLDHIQSVFMFFAA